MKKVLPIIIILGILVVAVIYLKPKPSVEDDVASGEITRNDAIQIDDTDAKVFTVTGDNFAYDVKEIRVKKGDVVKINFKNSEGFHDFVIDELAVNSGKIEAGQETSLTFIANEAGTFEYYCSVGQHRANGMWGKLIVTE